MKLCMKFCPCGGELRPPGGHTASNKVMHRSVAPPPCTRRYGSNGMAVCWAVPSSGLPHPAAARSGRPAGGGCCGPPRPGRRSPACPPPPRRGRGPLGSPGRRPRRGGPCRPAVPAALGRGRARGADTGWEARLPSQFGQTVLGYSVVCLRAWDLHGLVSWCGLGVQRFSRRGMDGTVMAHTAVPGVRKRRGATARSMLSAGPQMKPQRKRVPHTRN